MSILNKIRETKIGEVGQLYKQYSIEYFDRLIDRSLPALSMTESFSGSSNISVISEIKKASPSKGLISSRFDHMEIAREYLDSGTDAISVLTDENYFMGSIDFLKQVSGIRNKPLLRKDFIIDPLQVYQSKAAGADVILLISELLTQQQIRDLTLLAYELNMEVLLEIHSERQLDKIDFELNKLIGINNRNLDNFVTDLNTTVRLSKSIPGHTVLVSESGISNRDDFEVLKNSRVNAVLVGEYFMRSGNITAAMQNIKNWGRREN